MGMRAHVHRVISGHGTAVPLHDRQMGVVQTIDGAAGGQCRGDPVGRPLGAAHVRSPRWFAAVPSCTMAPGRRTASPLQFLRAAVGGRRNMCWHCGCRATHRVAPTAHGNARVVGTSVHADALRARQAPHQTGPAAVREPPLPGRRGRTRGAMARGRARFARIRTHRGANVTMRAHVHATISGHGTGVPLRGNPLQLDAAAASNSTTVTPAPPSCGPAS